MSFEERTEDIVKNFSSLGFHLQDLIDGKKLSIDFVSVERGEIEETGEYNLEGLFVRLDHAISMVKAKRVVLDTIEALFSGLSNTGILRAELRRLFYWLKNRGVTTVITGERGKDNLTRHGLEEYVADCVILLDHTVNDHISTRRMRIVKYRGSVHCTDEYPFLIDENGISVLPITSLKLDHEVSGERITTGVARLDAMLGGKGIYRGTSVLISGTSGTGKSTLAATFALSCCKRGEKVLYFAFEEAANQVVRNMRSVGINLEACLKEGNLRIEASRPTAWGLELHLASMHKAINRFKPDAIVIDPISNLTTVGSENEVRSMLVRLIDFIKAHQITGVFTDLITGDFKEGTDVGVSSLMDTWILLKSIEINGERNRGIYVLKARGIAHSNQIREFRLTSKGIDIIDVYNGPAGVLTGTARIAQEATEKAEALIRKQEYERLQAEVERKRKILASRVSVLTARFHAEKADLLRSIEEQKLREKVLAEDTEKIARMRKSDNGKN
jgi:circadian clock protein KaiC